MKQTDFMKQLANEMSVSELAEAIKIKSVLRTKEEEFKVGDRVEIVKDWSFTRSSGIEGKIGTIMELNNKVRVNYPYQLKLEEGGLYWVHKIKKAKPKAEWTDITKDCKFMLRDDGDGFVLTITEKENKFVGHLGLNGFYFPNPDVYRYTRRETLFKILTRGD